MTVASGSLLIKVSGENFLKKMILDPLKRIV